MQDPMIIFVPILFLISMVSFIVLLFVKETLHYRLIKRLFPSEYGNTRNLSHFNWVFFMSSTDLELLIWFHCPIYYKKTKITQGDRDASVIVKKLEINNIRMLVSLFLMVSSMVILFL